MYRNKKIVTFKSNENEIINKWREITITLKFLM